MAKHAQGFWPFAGAVLLLFVVTPAFAQDDTEPPAISHDEVKSARVGEPVVIGATITDPSGVFDPTLLYRVGGDGEFLRLPMTKVPGQGDAWDEDRFEATIPGDVVSGDLEYFIEAFDEMGNGPARYADADLPVKVRVLVGAEPLAPPPGAAAEQGDGGAVWLVAGVVGGGLALAAATAAVVGIVFLLRPPDVPAQVDVVINAPTPIAGVTP